MLTPDEVLGWTPDEMRSWLESRPSDEQLNWLGLGEGAAMAASSEDVAAARRDALAEVALHAFEMAARDSEARPGILLSELTMRAGLIDRLGTSPGGARDEQTLLDLISREVEIAADAKDKVVDGPIDLMSTPRSDLRLLRHVKNVLRSAELLLTQKADLPESVAWWWARRDRLP